MDEELIDIQIAALQLTRCNLPDPSLCSSDTAIFKYIKHRVALDLERLHTLVTEGKTYRGQGSTTLACDTLINQVALGNIKKFVAVVVKFRDVWHIAPMLADMGLDIAKYERRRSCITTKCGATIEFVPEPFLEQRTRGLEGYMIVNFVDYSP
jgi:hypothetical protein